MINILKQKRPVPDLISIEQFTHKSIPMEIESRLSVIQFAPPQALTVENNVINETPRKKQFVIIKLNVLSAID